jgi:hypothetical protein
MYMNGFKCDVKNSKPNAPPLMKPQLARRCGADPANGRPQGDPKNCTVGAKQPLYWYQAEGSTFFEGTYSPPLYNDLYDFKNGAQLDIFDYGGTPPQQPTTPPPSSQDGSQGQQNQGQQQQQSPPPPQQQQTGGGGSAPAPSGGNNSASPPPPPANNNSGGGGQQTQPTQNDSSNPGSPKPNAGLQTPPDNNTSGNTGSSPAPSNGGSTTPAPNSDANNGSSTGQGQIAPSAGSRRCKMKLPPSLQSNEGRQVHGHHARFRARSRILGSANSL